jgi:hypothetical protein
MTLAEFGRVLAELEIFSEEDGLLDGLGKVTFLEAFLFLDFENGGACAAQGGV